jgi:hypothetical protein
VRLSTRRNAISFGDEPAHLQAHSVSWSRGAEAGRVESVAARYIEETNLYRATALGTSIFPWPRDLGGQRTPGRRPRKRPASRSMTHRHREAAVGPRSWARRAPTRSRLRMRI